MNIFKVLANGDGRILEPNVSAFLAFLLDPTQAHGLGSTFLERLLGAALGQVPRKGGYVVLPAGRAKVVSLALQSPYEVRVSTEVPVLLPDSEEAARKGKRRDIDIVIEIWRQTRSSLDESHVDHELLHVIAIENKIRDTSIAPGQLLDEYRGLAHKYREEEGGLPRDGINMVFLTRSSSDRTESACREFLERARELEEFREWSENGYGIAQLIWDPIELNTGGGASVYNQIAELLKADEHGQIDPIHEHTRYILKSFMSFIRSGFRSYLEERSDDRPAKDRTLYTFAGVPYFKSRLPWAVIRAFTNANSPNLAALQQAFPDSLLARNWRFKGLICRAEDVQDHARRYYLKHEDLITLTDGVAVAVSNQWDPEGINSFIRRARELGFHID